MKSVVPAAIENHTNYAKKLAIYIYMYVKQNFLLTFSTKFTKNLLDLKHYYTYKLSYNFYIRSEVFVDREYLQDSDIPEDDIHNVDNAGGLKRGRHVPEDTAHSESQDG